MSTTSLNETVVQEVPDVHEAGKHTLQNFSIALILVGYYAISTFMLIMARYVPGGRPVLPFTILFCLFFAVLIIGKVFRGDIHVYVSPTICVLIFITLMCFTNNPYTYSSIEKSFYFVAVTVIPCIYIYLCDISSDDYQQISNFLIFFSIILICVVLYAYANVGTLDARVTSQKESGLYEIGVARSLTIATLVYIYSFMSKKGIIKKILTLALILTAIALITFTGKRQALMAIVLAPLAVNLINMKRPFKIVISIAAAATFIALFYYIILPVMLESGPLSKTKMAEYLERQYYDKSNITSMAGRVDAYKITLAVIAEKPLIGIGFNNFGKYTKQKYHLRNEQGDPHNLWLSIMVELGVVTFIFTMFLLFSFIKNILLAVWRYTSSSHKYEVILLCQLSVVVLLFSMVGLTLGRGAQIFFIMPVLMEKMHQGLRYQDQKSLTVSDQSSHESNSQLESAYRRI
ncbi:MAG: O-antigen ligase family protein [Deltaproteobacteria bacterium]|nr:O-antigen ligase family protein [Deltaproteobacteria bacterium]